MMTEISLNILDIAQNSVRAKASLIEISVYANFNEDTLTVIIKDNGFGMSDELLSKVTDPFFTTRTTRKIGLGLPFYKQAAEDTGGSFNISSKLGCGTCVTAVFKLSSIDRMPLGDMTFTIHTLITLNENINFIYTYQVNDRKFVLDTREFREILGDVSFKLPEISSYIKDYLNENRSEVDGNFII